jgi:hypothetical protein
MFKLKRTIVMSLLAALLIPVAASAQTETAPVAPASPKYEAYVGVAYSRLKQVPNSYSGLIGGKASLSRYWGRYFQLTGSVDYYKVGTGHSGLVNRGDPSIYTFLVAPGVHAPLLGNVSMEVFAELGGEHTGGEKMTPDISFAGGFGGGLSYALGHNLSLKLIGDRVGASFSLPNNSPQLAYSTNRTWNARGTFGVAYRF